MMADDVLILPGKYANYFGHAGRCPPSALLAENGITGWRRAGLS